MTSDSTRLLIFDWDGTLSDSLAVIVQCLQLAATDVDLPVPTDEQGRDIIGLGLGEALARLFPGAGDRELTELQRRYSALYPELDADPTPFYQGVTDTLDRLHEQGFLLAVATGKSRRGLDRVLAGHGMEGYFHATRCADETASKPDPLMLRELLDHFDVPARQAWMVGDTEYDMAMARSAGIPRVGVAYGAHAPHRLWPYDPLACLEAFPDLDSHLQDGRRMG